MSRLSEEPGSYYLSDEHASDVHLSLCRLWYLSLDEYLDSSRETRIDATTNCHVPDCCEGDNIAVIALVEEDDLTGE